MLDHLCINVSNLSLSRRFYTAALAPLGYQMTRGGSEAVGFGILAGRRRSLDPDGDFWIAQGSVAPPLPHLAFSAANRNEVDAFFRAAIQAGGTDNGPPGLRPRYHPHYYAGFIIDPDGYNIEAVCHLDP